MDRENAKTRGAHKAGAAPPPQATGRRAISYFGKRGEVVVVLEPEQKQTVPGKDAIPIAQLLRVVRKRRFAGRGAGPPAGDPDRGRGRRHPPGGGGRRSAAGTANGP